MSPPEIPVDVRNFVARYLPSVEHLEVLILLQRAPDRYWSAADVAAELKISMLAAERALERLGTDNFLDIKISNDVVYRFNPATPRLAGLAEHCLEIYYQQRIALTNLVNAGAVRPLRDFADAFRLRKGPFRG